MRPAVKTMSTHHRRWRRKTSDFLSQDVPGVNMYSSLSRSRIGRDMPKHDKMPECRSQTDVSLTGYDSAHAENLLRIESPEVY